MEEQEMASFQNIQKESCVSERMDADGKAAVWCSKVSTFVIDGVQMSIF